MRLCVYPQVHQTGGPATFQRKLANGLAQLNIGVTYDLANSDYDTILVVNSTRQIPELLMRKRQGVRIVQRLGTPFLQHRDISIGIRQFLLTELRNYSMQFLRRYIADHVVYQSRYVQEQWEMRFGKAKVDSSIIYNGVDLDKFSPHGPRYNKKKIQICLLNVEGTLGTDLSQIAIQLGQGLCARGMTVEVLAFGAVLTNLVFNQTDYPFIKYLGIVDNAELAAYYRGADGLLFTDTMTGGCPNTVIEALACGTPILGYNAGVLPEIITEDAGRLVECHGNPSRLEALGNQEGLVNAAIEISQERTRLSKGARFLAEQRYDVNKMIDEYVRILVV